MKKSRNARCFLNGQEVTKRCFYYDGRRQIVRLYDVDANGKKTVSEDGVAWSEYRGRVKLTYSREAA